MEAYSLRLIILWFLPLWLLGWLALPLTQRIFRCLPDAGLAAGRILALLLISLLAFWGASLHLLPLSNAPFLFTLPVLLALFISWRYYRNAEYSAAWRSILKEKGRAFLLSDAIFVLAFLFFTTLRLYRPEISEFEKPMDSAIIGSLARSTFLPAENPWFAGLPFTNYYYFGHFMASLLKRLFATPLPYAYNLIQPAFCALFLSTLWSLCAALCKSLRYGVLTTFIVALCGNFEPLRQWLTASPESERNTSFPYLDWWSTSRVVPDTINEYPFFTLALGDAHAHFFSLPLAAFLLCSCYAYYKSNLYPESSGKFHQLLTFIIVSVSLGAILMTNAWDFPVYALFAMLVVFFSSGTKHELFKRVLYTILLPFFAIVLALPLILRFESQVGGIKIDFWTPSAGNFFLMWGGFLLLLYLLLAFDTAHESRAARHAALSSIDTQILSFSLLLLLFALLWPPLLPFGLIFLFVATASAIIKGIDSPQGSEKGRIFIRLLLLTGLITLLLPFSCYLQGYFSGDLRRQDTVFKFGLQAWLLLGVGSTCGLMRAAALAPLDRSRTFSLSTKIIGSAVLILLWLVPVACSLSIVFARTSGLHHPAGALSLTLNGARDFPLSDQKAMLWLEANAPISALIVEAVGRDANGDFHAAYGDYGRVSALTGVPAYIGWPQHARFWGAPEQEIQARLLETERFFMGMTDTAFTLTPSGRRNRLCFIFYGGLEQQPYNIELPEEAQLIFRSNETRILLKK